MCQSSPPTTKICLELDLNWKKYLVGQAYDGASNMRGAYNGLQALIKQHNSSALYVGVGHIV